MDQTFMEINFSLVWFIKFSAMWINQCVEKKHPVTPIKCDEYSVFKNDIVKLKKLIDKVIFHGVKNKWIEVEKCDIDKIFICIETLFENSNHGIVMIYFAYLKSQVKCFEKICKDLKI